MDSNWATEQLQTIRTLMERSALYRRALAPVMLVAGALGVIGAGIGLLLHLDSPRAFGILWLGTAIVAVTGALLITRRQAIKDNEVFWSPPTRRVVQALAPPLLVGLFFGGIPLLKELPPLIPAMIWILCYGLALHAAGFFMPRGIKLFGWLFMASTCAFYVAADVLSWKVDFNPHFYMGFFFGVLHLAYGAYLYLTERGKNEA